MKQNTNTSKGFSGESGWVVLNEIETRIKSRIEALGTPLKDWDIQINYGIKTGFNEAFIIEGKIRDELLKKCPEAAEIIRPILKGRNIKNYVAEFNDLWVIFTRKGVDIDRYPSVKEHLFQYYEKLKPKGEKDLEGRKPGSYKWFEIQDNVAYYNDFYKEKLIWIELSDQPKFSYDDKGYFVEATAFILTGEKLKFLAAFLNSKLSDWYFDKITTTSGVGTNRWKKIYIENLPIPQINKTDEFRFNQIVDEIISNKADGIVTKDLDDRVNDMVLELYDLDFDEKELILGFDH